MPDTVDQAAVSPEQAALRQEQTSELCALLGVLSEGHRTVLWLRLGLGLSAGEVAVELGCSAGAVRVRQHRALSHLRAHIANRFRLQSARETVRAGRLRVHSVSRNAFAGSTR